MPRLHLLQPRHVQFTPIHDVDAACMERAARRRAHRAWHAELTGIAPLLIQVGAAETLLDDSIRLAGVAGAAHVPVSLEVWPEMIHVWHVYHPNLAAGRRAIERGGAYVKAVLDGNPPIDSRPG